jgi:hypothetical protein
MMKFSKWLVEKDQETILSGCQDRYAQSKSSGDDLIQFLRTEMNDAINRFVDTKTEALAKRLNIAAGEQDNLRQQLATANRSLATAKTNHVELLKQYKLLKSQSSASDSTHKHILELEENNRRLHEQNIDQEKRFDKWAEEQKVRAKEMQMLYHEHMRRQDNHIRDQATKINELQSIVQALQSGSRTSPHLSPMSAAMEQAAKDRDRFQESPDRKIPPLVVGRKTGIRTTTSLLGLPPSPPPLGGEEDDGALPPASESGFELIIHSLRIHFEEEIGVENFRGDYDRAPLIVNFSGKLRGGVTSLRAPQLVKHSNLRQDSSIGYEQLTDSYKILGNPQETYWFLIFYGPYGDYLTNVPNHDGHEINQLSAYNINGQDCIIFNVKKASDVGDQMQNVLSSLIKLGYPELADMVRNILSKDDEKEFAQKAPPSSRSFIQMEAEDPELARALEMSMHSHREDEERRRYEEAILHAGADEEKTGNKFAKPPSIFNSDYVQPVHRLSSAEKRQQMIWEITDIMGALGITRRSQSTGDYRGWRNFSGKDLEKLFEKLKRQWEIQKKNLKQWS